jgi:hypothetical protein
MQGLLPAARLHLARGDLETARAAAQRGLRVMAADRLRAAELLAVLVDVELAAGDVDAAAAASDDLIARTADMDVPGLRCRALAARSRMLAARGDPGAAIATLEMVVDRIDPARSPWLRATLLIELARRRDEAGDRAQAALDAKAAVGALADLDVVLADRDRELLERLNARPRSQPPATARLSADGGWWRAEHDGVVVRLPATKGLRYLAELVARPGVEQHALDLVDRVEGVGEDGVDRRSLGDAGELLDCRARRAYRRRIEELRSEIDDAMELGAFERAESLQGELAQLVAQLAAALGLGGRGRRAASAAERARLNVTRALRAATAKLAAALPGVGDALDRRIRTGIYCAFEPTADDIRWVVQF